MGYQRIQMTNKWLLLAFVAVVAALLVIILIFMTQPKTLDDIDLQRIISLSSNLKRKDSDRYCEDYLQLLSERAEQQVWPRLGLFPPGNQLREEILIKGCIRTATVIFPNSSSADTAFQSLRAANDAPEATTIVYDNVNDEMVVFTTPFTFEYTISIFVEPAKYEGENLLLITKKCNTVVTIFAFKKNEEVDQSATFGMVVEDDEIVAYAQQIRDGIEDIICPIVVSPE